MHLHAAALLALLPAVLAASFAPASLLCQINADRARYGLKAYGLSKELSTASFWHSLDMAQHNKMASTGSDGSSPGDRISKAGFDWSSYREIIAFNYPAANLYANLKQKEVYRDMFFSSKLQMFGAAVVESADGSPYYTVDFGLDGNGIRNVPSCAREEVPSDEAALGDVSHVADKGVGEDRK